MLAAAFAALALASSAAMAADIAPYAAPTRPAPTTGKVPTSAPISAINGAAVSNSPTNPSGVAGGVQAGYNWQFGQFVFGAETDLQASDADDVFAPWKFSNPWFGTVRGRAGVAMNNVLFYGTLGLAYGTLRAQSTLTGATESQHPCRLGRAAPASKSR